MSDTSSALKAAREVQADTLAPELFRQANEWFMRAKREYKLKNFQIADEYAHKARYFAEQAEFEAMRNGAKRVEYSAPDPLSNQGVISGAATTTNKAPQTPAAPVMSPINAPPPFQGAIGNTGGGPSFGGGGAGGMPGGGAMGTALPQGLGPMPTDAFGGAGGMPGAGGAGMPGAGGAGIPGAGGAGMPGAGGAGAPAAGGAGMPGAGGTGAPAAGGTKPPGTF